MSRLDTKASFCAVPLESLVYAGPRTRAEFDRLPLPELVGEWRLNNATTLIKGDGQQWETLSRSKSLTANGITVIFQWRDERPVAQQAAA